MLDLENAREHIVRGVVDAKIRKTEWTGSESPWITVAIEGDFSIVPTELACSLIAEVERQDALLKRAMAIITDAIMHGMPITQEVADVRNEIVCKKNPCKHEWIDAKNEVVAGGEVCLNCGAVRG